MKPHSCARFFAPALFCPKTPGPFGPGVFRVKPAAQAPGLVFLNW